MNVLKNISYKGLRAAARQYPGNDDTPLFLTLPSLFNTLFVL